MPVITIEYDDKIVSDKEMKALCNGIQQIVSETTKIDDVPVYAHSSPIKVKHAPIEIVVQISAHKVANLDVLMAEVKQRLVAWKAKQFYQHPINLTIIPMNWKFEIGI
jgi:hypothetical protein